MNLHPLARRVQEALDRAGAGATVVEMTASTRTSEDAARALGTDVRHIAKSLVFRVGDGLVLVIASGSDRVDLAKLSAACGAPARRADADAVKAATGFPIGGVPPLGHRTPLPTYLDRRLLALDHVWAAAGTPQAVFRTTPADLVRITGGTVADLAVEPAGGG